MEVCYINLCTSYCCDDNNQNVNKMWFCCSLPHIRNTASMVSYINEKFVHIIIKLGRVK